MGYNGHVVIDMDSHIRQYWDLDRTYKEYMAPEYRETYLRFSAAAHALMQRAGDRGFSEFLWPALPTRPLGVYEAYEVQGNGSRSEQAVPGDRASTHAGVKIDPACNWDPAIRLRDMETASVDISVIFPSSADSFCALRDVGFESALHQAFHRFMNNYCADAGGRLWWIGAATMRDIPKTIAQLKYWTKHDSHFAGLQIPRACPDGRMLDNPDLHPLYAASSRTRHAIMGSRRREPAAFYSVGRSTQRPLPQHRRTICAGSTGRRRCLRFVPEAPHRPIRELRRLDALLDRKAG